LRFIILNENCGECQKKRKVTLLSVFITANSRQFIERK
jgi:hypothetical protein